MTALLTRRRLVARASILCASAALGAATAGRGEPAQRVETGAAALSFDALYSSSVTAAALSGEAADRIAIRTLIDAWARYADRRMAGEQAALMTEDGLVSVYDGEPEGREPLVVHHGRDALRESVARHLGRYAHTTHMNGQSALAVSGARAIGETYCLAHHLLEEDGRRTLQILSIRYYDDFRRVGDLWRFAERRLIIDWSDTRPSEA